MGLRATLPVVLTCYCVVCPDQTAHGHGNKLAQGDSDDGKAKQKQAKRKKSKTVNGFELKPSDYQPSKKELESDVRVSASFDQLVDAVFAADRKQTANS